ncbi:MAG: helix-turn-helix transcriptional regulator [Clostridia bacterium]|nr:helix-turn-helix transcriptional regulator [Clostridia bacterium]
MESIILNVGEASRNRILELCNENHITLNKLATISGVTQSTLNNIVSGRNNSTTVSTIKKLCDGLGITIIDFFNTEEFKNLEQEIK